MIARGGRECDMKNVRRIKELVDDTFSALKYKGVDVAKKCFEGIEPLIESAPENIKQSFARTIKAFDGTMTIDMIDGYVGLFADEVRRKRVSKERNAWGDDKRIVLCKAKMGRS